jgi:hypothetical protein
VRGSTTSRKCLRRPEKVDWSNLGFPNWKGGYLSSADITIARTSCDQYARGEDSTCTRHFYFRSIQVQSTQSLNNTNAQAYGIPLKTTGSQSLVGDRKAGSSLLLHCRGWALQVTADYMSEKCGLGEGTCGGERLEPGGGYMGDWNC